MWVTWIGWVTVAALACLIGLRSLDKGRAKNREYWEKYNQAHQPLSDLEFLDRMPSNIRPEIALKVRRFISEYYGIEYERVHPDTSIAKASSQEL